MSMQPAMITAVIVGAELTRDQRIAHELDRPVATPSQAREILRLDRYK